jgi:hypothetical protein
MYGYIIVHVNSNGNEITCEYISLRNTIELLKKYKVYIFKYNKNSDILYLEYPFKYYYSSKTVNIIEYNDNKEEAIQSYGYIEIRLTNIVPVGRFFVNMLDL